MKLTRTEHQLTHQRSKFMTSPVYIRNTYEHGRHGISWRLSACTNSVYQALSPPLLGTRLVHPLSQVIVDCQSIHYLLHTSICMKRKCLLFSSLVWGLHRPASIQALGYTCFITVIRQLPQICKWENFL